MVIFPGKKRQDTHLNVIHDAWVDGHYWKWLQLQPILGRIRHYNPIKLVESHFATHTWLLAILIVHVPIIIIIHYNPIRKQTIPLLAQTHFCELPLTTLPKMQLIRHYNPHQKIPSSDLPGPSGPGTKFMLAAFTPELASPLLLPPLCSTVRGGAPGTEPLKLRQDGEAAGSRKQKGHLGSRQCHMAKGFYRVWYGLIGFYRVLKDLKGFYRVL